ncbi:NAD-dependent epimerase/dehydratase family protein, partial [Curtobacterium sp. B8]|uniref:NAD-dependent epimerase/dehydratase family protein n=1 Tax=Curtobacterium sp. B8 TaxID=95611 RepID=UPI0011D21667
MGTPGTQGTPEPKPRVVVAGASGFVGQALRRAFADEGYEVVTVGRTGDAVWGNTLRIRELVEVPRWS